MFEGLLPCSKAASHSGPSAPVCPWATNTTLVLFVAMATTLASALVKLLWRRLWLFMLQVVKSRPPEGAAGKCNGSGRTGLMAPVCNSAQTRVKGHAVCVCSRCCILPGCEEEPELFVQKQ